MTKHRQIFIDEIAAASAVSYIISKAAIDKAAVDKAADSAADRAPTDSAAVERMRGDSRAGTIGLSIDDSDDEI